MADPVVNIILKASDQTKGVLGGVGSALGGIGKIAIGLAAAGLGAFSVAAVKGVQAASDLSETINKSNVIFGDAAGVVQQFASAAADGLGQSQQAALDAAATFGIFGKAAGLTGDELADFATGFTGLASDLASFNNTSPEEAVLALGAALRGESEPLRRYGVLLDDASMRQKALELGIISTTKDALTPQQKVLAAQALIYEQTADAQGDFARTSEGLANSQRVVQAQLANLSATFGQIFLPIVERFTRFLSADVLPKLNWLAVAFQDAGLFSIEFKEALGAIVGDGTAESIMTFLKDLSDWLGVNIPIAIQMASDVWSNVLLPALTTVWTWMSTVLFPFLTDVVYPWLAVNIPKAVQFLSDMWTNVLQPALEAVWGFIRDFVIPLLEVLANAWLQGVSNQTKLLGYIWQNVLKPAIEAVWRWMSTVLIPFLQNVVYPWIQENLPKAIQTLSDFWTLTLKPALEAVWAFIRDYLIPLFSALWQLFSEVGRIAVEGLVLLWNTKLKPALELVWKFISEKVIPILSELWKWFSEKVGPIIQEIVDGALTNLKKIFKDIRDFIQTVIDKVLALVEKLKLIKMPKLTFGTTGGTSDDFGVESRSIRAGSLAATNRLTVYGGLHLHGIDSGGDLLNSLSGLMIG